MIEQATFTYSSLVKAVEKEKQSKIQKKTNRFFKSSKT